MIQETVLVHNRIYSLLETVGRTNPAIDWNTTPSPDYSKLKFGDHLREGASLSFEARRLWRSYCARANRSGRQTKNTDRAAGMKESSSPLPDATGGMESKRMRKPGRGAFMLGSKNQVVYFQSE